MPTERASDLILEDIEKVLISQRLETPAWRSRSEHLNLPASVDLRATLLPVQDQGPHPTCVAFAVTALCEHYFGGTRKLSERHLHYLLKERDLKRSGGGRISAALSAVSKAGICPRDTWPYDADHWINGGPGVPPAAAEQAAKPYRMVNSRHIAPFDVAEIKRILAGGDGYLGAPVVAAVAVFEDGKDAQGQSHTAGIFRLARDPLVPLSGHAVLIVGYQDTYEVNSGGYLIARNSWGANWAPDSPVGPGHALIPYDYASVYTFEAASSEGVSTDARLIGATPPAMPGDRSERLILNRDVRDYTGSLLKAGTPVLRRGAGFIRAPSDR